MLLDPYYSERPWGGRELEERLGKDLPPGLAIGESWELSDHPDGRSKIANGPYQGRNFGDIAIEHPDGMYGVSEPPARARR